MCVLKGENQDGQAGHLDRQHGESRRHTENRVRTCVRVCVRVRVCVSVRAVCVCVRGHRGLVVAGGLGSKPSQR